MRESLDDSVADSKNERQMNQQLGDRTQKIILKHSKNSNKQV